MGKVGKKYPILAKGSKIIKAIRDLGDSVDNENVC